MNTNNFKISEFIKSFNYGHDKNENISRKEREKAEKISIFIRSAEKLFAGNGFHNTTMEDIAGKAEYSKGTLYLYFKSKEDLFLSVFEMRFKELYDMIDRNIDRSEDPLISLKKIMGIFFIFTGLRE